MQGVEIGYPQYGDRRGVSTVDLNRLFDRSEREKVVLAKMRGNELILFVGKTKAGKTSTICSLAERDLVIRQELQRNGDFGDEVVDTVEPVEGFLIGHGADSTTRNTNFCALPRTPIYLLDSCGFGDTSGVDADIENAISLRNTVNASLSLRLVLVVDVRMLPIDGGVAFANLLKILIQFFSPMEQVLPCMSFLFTHGSPQLTPQDILKDLNRLLSAAYIQGSPPLLNLIEHLYSYVKKNGRRCIVNPTDLTDDMRAYSKRDDLRDLILQTTPFTNKNVLGCPLAEDAQYALREKFQEINTAVTHFLVAREYSLAQSNMELLLQANSLLDLPFLKPYYEDACRSIVSHVSELSEASAKCLEDRHFPALKQLVNQIRSALVLPLGNVQELYNNLKKGINQTMAALSASIYEHLECESSTNDKADVRALDELSVIDRLLPDTIPKSLLETHGYAAVTRAVEHKFQSYVSRSSQVLDCLGCVLDSALPEDKYIALVNGLPILASPAASEETKGAKGVEWRLACAMKMLLTDLARLRDAEEFKEHLSDQVISAYTSRVKALTDTLLAAYGKFFEANGLLKCVESLSITADQCAYLSRMHSILHALYSAGANDYLETPRLCYLDETIIDKILSALGNHLSLIDRLLIEQDFKSICRPLTILLGISLADDRFTDFIRTQVKHKGDVISAKLQQIYVQCEESLKSFQVRDSLQASDLSQAVKVMQIMKEAAVLDPILFGTTCCAAGIDAEVLVSSPAPSMDDRFSVSNGLSSLYRLSHALWTAGLSQFQQAFASSDRELCVCLFSRLDQMYPLGDIFHSISNDTKLLCTAVESSARQICSVDFTRRDISPADLATSFKKLDCILAFLRALENSLLLSHALCSDVCIESIRSPLLAWRKSATVAVGEVLEECRSSCRLAFASTNAPALNDALETIRVYCVLDEYLCPTASSVYAGAKEVLKLEMSALNTAAQEALSRGEGVKKEVRLFLEDSTAYAHHFPDVDFRSCASDLLKKQREAAVRIPDQIASLLSNKNKYHVIKRVLVNLFGPRFDRDACQDPADKALYDECDELLTASFAEISLSISSCDSMVDIDAIAHLMNVLTICSNAMNLSGTTSTDPIGLIIECSEACERVYARIVKAIDLRLQRDAYLEAARAFEVLLRCRRFDIVLDKYRQALHTNSSSFSLRVSEYRDRRIDNISKSIFEAFNSTIFMPQQEKDVDLDSISSNSEFDGGDVFAGMDLARLNRIVESVSSASAAHLTFEETTVDFDSIKRGLASLAVDALNRIERRIRSCIGNRGQRDRTELDTAHNLLETFEHLLQAFAPLLDPRRLQTCEKTLARHRSALERARGERCIFQFDSDSLQEAKRILLQLEEKDDADFDVVYGQVISQFNQAEQQFRQQLQEQTITTDDWLLILDFMKALVVFEKLIVTSNDCSTRNACDSCRSTFSDHLKDRFEILRENGQQCRDLQRTNQDLRALHTMVSDLRAFESGMVDMGENGKGRRQSRRLVANSIELYDIFLTMSSELLSEISSSLAIIENDRHDIKSFDLFASQDMAAILEKLSRLEDQICSSDKSKRKSSPWVGTRSDSMNQDLSRIQSQLQTAHGRFEKHFQSSEYDIAEHGIRNLISMESSPRYADPAKLAVQHIIRTIHREREDLLSKFCTCFRSSDFKGLESVISSASSIDKTVIATLQGEVEPMMPSIVDAFKKEFEELVSKSKHSTDIKDHVDTVIRMKTFVCKISNVEIQQLAKLFIQSYLTKAGSIVDLFQLGIVLANDSPLGHEVTDEYNCFEAVRNQRFNEATATISNEHALAALADLNPDISPVMIATLRNALTSYDSVYERHLRAHLPGYDQYRTKPIDHLVKAIQAQAKESSPDLVGLLGGIFALWTILSSRQVFAETNSRSCLMKPHPVQLVAIFRLIGIDEAQGGMLSWLVSLVSSMFPKSSSSPIPGHVIQVGTGEGKSILLGGLSCLLGLLGYEIFCASYSKYLSERDFSAFLPLFDALGITPLVHYSTLSDLAESIINEKGNVRELAESRILNKAVSRRQKAALKSFRKRILLIDEVDVFFSESFFGATYNPMGEFSCVEVQTILTTIFNRRGSISFEQVQSMPEYAALLSQFCSEARPLIDQHIRLMIQDAPNFAEPQYEIVTLQDGTTRIGYKDHDRVSCSTKYGYRTAFAYLHELQRHPALADHLPGALSLQIPCGIFSYADIPKQSFSCIMGVTGTPTTCMHTLQYLSILLCFALK